MQGLLERQRDRKRESEREREREKRDLRDREHDDAGPHSRTCLDVKICIQITFSAAPLAHGPSKDGRPPQ